MPPLSWHSRQRRSPTHRHIYSYQQGARKWIGFPAEWT
jgi:hypothetical protein